MGGGQGEGWRFAKSLDVRRAIGLKKEEEAAASQTPDRLVSTWTETVLNRQGEPPQRGFGGRLLFFSEDSEDPVRVDGQLVVYAYDDEGRAAHETQPTRRFVFPREQFTRHESDSKLGASYSFWLPWDAVGGQQKNIGLIARFEPHQGALIVGEQTRHLLPGTRRLAGGKTAPAVEQVGEVRLAQYSKTSELQTSTAQKVTSIKLDNSSWQSRLAAARRKSSQAASSEVAKGTPALPDAAR